MVVIRKLSLPKKANTDTRQHRRRTHIVRTMAEFPPPTPQPTPCRLWQGAADKDGYGRMKRLMPDGSYKHKTIHRWVVEQVLGRDLKPSEFILHACDNPPCYRYDHLSVGTVQDNNADMFAKGRASKPPVNRLKGTKNGRAKLTPHNVEQIRRLYKQGLAAARIAEQYGVSRATIYKITNGLSWKPETEDLLAKYREEE